MIVRQISFGKLFLGAALVLAFAGCQDKPKATEAALDVTNIQGSSFDEPVVAKTDTAGDAIIVAPAEASPELKDQASTVVVASAADVPDDISKIPSATPAPVLQTPVPAPASAPAPDPGSSQVVAAGDYQPLNFKLLSGYKYEEPVPAEGEKPEDVEKRRAPEQIPPEIKALDGKKAVVEGWMVPMEINEDGSVKSFVLVKTQPQCCFGDMQAMNEWVDVAMMPGKNAEFNVDLPIKVYGQLEVGEKKQDGFVLSIYRMQADRVEL